MKFRRTFSILAAVCASVGFVVVPTSLMGSSEALGAVPSSGATTNWVSPTPITNPSQVGTQNATQPSITQTVTPDDGNQSSAYYWTFGMNYYYGECDALGCETIGQIRESASVSLNGKQARNTQGITVLSGPPIAAALYAQCYWLNQTTTCSNDTVHEASTYTDSYSYTFKQSDGNSYIILPTGGTNRIHFNYNWLAYGYSNPNQANGRFYAGAVHSYQINCTTYQFNGQP
jgi:hypothetical protein